MSVSGSNKLIDGPEGVGKASEDVKIMARLGYGVIVVFVFGFAIWTGLARLDSAVISTGSVTHESRRKVVQHFEGGIVQDILVREGQNVSEGQVLFRLEDTQSRANLEVVMNTLDGLLAQEARLVAERDEAQSISFPAELLARNSSPSVKNIMQDQIAQFKERRSSITGQVVILEGRVQQYQSEVNGLKLELQSAEKQLAFIEEELVGVRDLAEKGLVPKSRWLALEREAARLQGILGRNEAESSKALNSISEMRLQIQQTKQKVREEVSATLQDTRQKLNDARERKRVSEDILRRVDIVSPRAGRVQNVKLATKGAVIRSGDPIAEVVPVADDFIVEAMVSPMDIDKIHEGAQAQVRFTNFVSRLTPVILGKVSTISRDRLIDEATRQPYFLAQILIGETDIPEKLKESLSAGMQVEIIIPVGERTVLQFLVQPLGDALAKAFRER